jgi:hypothetical protein
VKKNNFALRDEVERVLLERRSEIQRILDEYAIPQLPIASSSQNAGN